jgi:hypothetical protein
MTLFVNMFFVLFLDGKGGALCGLGRAMAHPTIFYF